MDTHVYNYDSISLNTSQNEKSFRQLLQRKSKHSYYFSEPPPFFFVNRAFCDIMWKNMVQSADVNTTRRMCFACWITKATDKHSEYVIALGFSTATICTGTRLNCTLYVHCLSC